MAVNLDKLRQANRKSLVALRKTLAELNEYRIGKTHGEQKDIDSRRNRISAEINHLDKISAHLAAASVVVKPIDPALVKDLEELSERIDKEIIKDAKVNSVLAFTKDLLDAVHKLVPLLKKAPRHSAERERRRTDEFNNLTICVKTEAMGLIIAKWTDMRLIHQCSRRPADEPAWKSSCGDSTLPYASTSLQHSTLKHASRVAHTKVAGRSREAHPGCLCRAGRGPLSHAQAIGRLRLGQASQPHRDGSG